MIINRFLACFALMMAGVVAAAADLNPSAPLRVLFIGNSFTAINDLPQMTARLAASARPPRTMETGFVGEGGATLQRHWNSGNALEAIRRGRWDFVVLQDQGALGWYDDFASAAPRIADPKMFHTYARLFDEEIRKAGARTVLFMTWARQDAPQTQVSLARAYVSIAEELKAMVAPAGVAWQRALQERPALVLHHADKSHPGPNGSYLAACTLYATLFSSSPEGLSSESLGEADAAFLRRVAWQTVENRQLVAAATRAGPEESAPATAPAARPPMGSEERGRAVFAAMQKASGGVERLRALKDYSLEFSAKVHTPMGEMALQTREIFVFPGVVRSESRFAFGEMVSFFDGNNGWRQTPQGVQDLPDRLKRMNRAQAIRNTLNLLRAEGQLSVRHEKREVIGGSEADLILVDKDGESMRLWGDALTGTLLKKAYRGVGTGGGADIEESYSDYREVEGVRIPFRFVSTQNGAPFMEGMVREVRFDTGANPAEMARKPEP